MIKLYSYNKYGFTLLALLTLLWSFNCCSFSGRAKSRSALKDAIGDYISGRRDRAEKRLKSLTNSLDGDDLCQAYLYLGRCYLDKGDYNKAAESFTLGRMNACEEPFDLFLTRVKNYAIFSSEKMVEAESITRAQLAFLLCKYLGDLGLSEQGMGIPLPPDVENHWASDVIAKVLEEGYMRVMPDGKFYPDRRVSRSSFIFIAANAIALSGNVGRAGLEGDFPETTGKAIGFYCGVSMNAGNRQWISGQDAFNIISNIARKAGLK